MVRVGAPSGAVAVSGVMTVVSKRVELSWLASPVVDTAEEASLRSGTSVGVSGLSSPVSMDSRSAVSRRGGRLRRCGGRLLFEAPAVACWDCAVDAWNDVASADRFWPGF